MGAIRKYEGKRGISWQIDYMGPLVPDEERPGKFKRNRIRQSFATRKQAAAELTARDYKIQQ
jgi:hypothetical protein